MKFKIKTLVVGPVMQNCRIIYDPDTRDAVVVDPGADFAKINKEINSLNLNLKAVLITHGHFDHVGAVQETYDAYHVPVMGPACEDDFLIYDVPRQSARFGLLPSPAITCDVDFLTDGKIIEPVLNLKLKVITTPGHTPGGICYYCKEEDFVLTGDTLFLESIGRTDFERGSLQDLTKSIVNKLFILPESTAVLSGHGGDSTIGHEREFNPFVR